MSIYKRSRGLALAIGGLALLAAPMASPAGAAPKPAVACAKLSSSTTLNVAKGTGTVTSAFLTCTPKGLAAGGTSKVTVPFSKLSGSITTKITWKNGKGTTTATEKFTTQKTIGACPKGTKYRTIISGSVKASTGAAAKIIKKGEPVSATVCTKQASSTKYTSTLMKGTKFKL
jgi:hypothetical protein